MNYDNSCHLPRTPSLPDALTAPSRFIVLRGWGAGSPAEVRTIVNNLSLAALASLPVIPPYSISKAAAFNMTQSLRALRRSAPHISFV
jgi:NAD(P)-dependent dehydrogenase (short-subunit alcohol dehydrogenase family)